MARRLKHLPKRSRIALAALTLLAIVLTLIPLALSMDNDYAIESGASAAGKNNRTPEPPPTYCASCIPIPGQPVETDTPVPPTATPTPAATNTPLPTNTPAPTATYGDPVMPTKEIHG